MTEPKKVFYVPVPEEEFYQRIGESVYSVFIKNNFSLPSKEQKTKWLNHLEAAAYLKKTPAALYKLTSNREIKFTKRGKPNYYRIEDLDYYMQSGMVKTTDEIAKEVRLIPRKNNSRTQCKDKREGTLPAANG